MLDNIDSDEVRRRKDESNADQNESMAGSNFSLAPLRCSFLEEEE
jgi:hypothetical protein